MGLALESIADMWLIRENWLATESVAVDNLELVRYNVPIIKIKFNNEFDLERGYEDEYE